MSTTSVSLQSTQRYLWQLAVACAEAAGSSDHRVVSLGIALVVHAGEELQADGEMPAIGYEPFNLSPGELDQAWHEAGR